MIDLKIGDKLWRYVDSAVIGRSGIHEVVVIEVHDTKNGKQYVVEDQTCKHDWNCQLLIAPTNGNKFKFIRQINDDEENSQERWHQNSDREFFFHTSRRYCLLDVAEINVSYFSEKLYKAKKEVERLEQDLARHKDTLAAAQAAIEEFEMKG